MTVKDQQYAEVSRVFTQCLDSSLGNHNPSYSLKTVQYIYYIHLLSILKAMNLENSMFVCRRNCFIINFVSHNTFSNEMKNGMRGMPF